MNAPSLEKLLSNQQNLERLIDNLKDGIIGHDLKRNIFYFNRKAEKITGYGRHEIMNKDCHEAFGAPFCGKRCSFCGNTPTLNDTVEYSTQIVSKSGETRDIELTATMMHDENGRNFGVLVAFKDVTELLNLRIRVGETVGFANIIGQDSTMISIFQQIRNVADYDFPVHISGETGTGKELVANAIHTESGRGGGPFVPINCGALPEGLIESELFGHVKGAFSGAIRDKKGRFELAHNGSVFLDEVADLPLALQVKFLRFIEEGVFFKVGGEKNISVDVRIISAANKNLQKEVKLNRFREDLYYRLNVIPIHIPPIRQRKTDIPLLINHFLSQLNKTESGVKKKRRSIRISEPALSLMMDYRWPGNVRELQNAIRYAIVKCRRGIIRPDDLPLEFNKLKNDQAKHGLSKKLNPDIVNDAMVKSGGNKAKAARILRVGRSTLYRFLDEHPDLFQSNE
ncbi:sigma 54-interacting transcriptional regulator [Desulfococcaceae bacterium HSG7]|nr:sigma 54-interacting transcriptional regulator [Desulfococcaceae bacterium HSG7]